MPSAQLDFFAGSSTKTFQESSARQTTPSAVSWEALSAQMTPSYRAPVQQSASRDHAGGGMQKQKSTSQAGQVTVWLPDLSHGLHGGFSIVNGSECPNDAVVCSLSQVLQTDLIQQKYFLSPVACSGILRRADKRGKILPEQLAHALRQVSDQAASHLEAVTPAVLSMLPQPLTPRGG